MSAKRRTAPRAQIRELARRSSIDKLAAKFGRSPRTIAKWVAQGPPANVRDELQAAFDRSERARLAAEARAEARAVAARREEERQRQRERAKEARRRERERQRAEEARREAERQRLRERAAEERRRERERARREEERKARNRSRGAKKAAAKMRARREIVAKANALPMTGVHGIRDARWDRAEKTALGTDAKGRVMGVFAIRNKKTGALRAQWLEIASLRAYRNIAHEDSERFEDFNRRKALGQLTAQEQRDGFQLSATSFESIYDVEDADYETIFDFDEEAA